MVKPRLWPEALETETDLDFQGWNTTGETDTWEAKRRIWLYKMLYGQEASPILYNWTVKVKEEEIKFRAEWLSDQSSIFCEYKCVTDAQASLLCLALANSMFCSSFHFTFIFILLPRAHIESVILALLYLHKHSE